MIHSDEHAVHRSDEHALRIGGHSLGGPELVQAGLASLQDMVEEAAVVLPEQAPLHAFVHHNTLHAFEDLSFEEAVLEAARILGTEPYLTEQEFMRHQAQGRILLRDLEAVVKASMPEDAEPFFPGGPTPAAFQVQRLQHLFRVPHARAIEFAASERDLWTRLHTKVSRPREQELLAAGQSPEALLRPLWEQLVACAPSAQVPHEAGLRRRDDLLRVTGVDTDEVVHPLLIRLCGAFLDQGVAYWTLPQREEGFLVAVRRLYGLTVAPPGRALRGLAEQLREQEQASWSATQTVEWALEELSVPKQRRQAFLQQTLLALRGWAGMMRQLEHHPDKAPIQAPPSSLMDFLAVRLVLDVVAGKNALEDHLGRGATFEGLAAHRAGGRGASDASGLTLAYEAFVLAQCLPVPLSSFAQAEVARRWLQEVRAFDALRRRQLLHLALERRHRVEVLDALCLRPRQQARVEPPVAQVIFCIDDREESTRRHLEEAMEGVSTYGYPGFFGVAMRYQAAGEHRSRALCPVSIKPQHFIQEQSESPVAQGGSWSQLLLHYHVGRQTLFRGALFSVVLGMLATIPWVIATVFRGQVKFGEAQKPSTPTRVEYHSCEEHGPEGLKRGFCVEEMANIVETMLVQTGMLKDGLAGLICLMGHGSSSVNNPHLAAYGCGATAGGCGGPNARVFCLMANDAQVRAELARRGVQIPEGTWFVGGWHDTCQDTVEWFDLHLLPEPRRRTWEQLRDAFQVALPNNARERTRLFGTVSLEIKPAAAKREVEARATDLSEARPEYNHAKNSLCIVGPRGATQGLFLDQRAFLVSYDPEQDPEGSRLSGVLRGSLPVCAGINLEYLFSTVDPMLYGAGSKLPHNITGLVGVMDGHASDLRTGLYQQMVELHEPVRLMAVVIASNEQVMSALAQAPGLRKLVDKRWIQLATQDPASGKVHLMQQGALVEYVPEQETLGSVTSSLAACAEVRAPVEPVQILGRGA